MLTDNASVITLKSGEVVLEFEHANIRLKKGFLMPGLGYNILSVGFLAENGIESIFRKYDVILRHGEESLLIGNGTRDEVTGLCEFPSPSILLQSGSALMKTDNDQLWNRRLAHVNWRDLCEVHKHEEGVHKLKAMDEIFRACRIGRYHKFSLKGSFVSAQNVCDNVNSDIVGPLEPSYPHRYRYFATINDYQSRYDFVGLMSQKSDIIDIFNAF